MVKGGCHVEQQVPPLKLGLYTEWASGLAPLIPCLVWRLRFAAWFSSRSARSPMKEAWWLPGAAPAMSLANSSLSLTWTEQGGGHRRREMGAIGQELLMQV